MIDWLAPRPGLRLLDVAGGTGDIAFRVLDRVARKPGPRARGDHVCDVNPRDARGRPRPGARRRTGSSRLDWLCADAEALPLRRSQRRRLHDRVRHPQRHPDRARARRGAPRAAAGRPVPLPRVLDSCSSPALRALYDAYSFTVVPWLGEQVAGDRAAYQYLVESIRRFPDQATFARLIEQRRARARPLPQPVGRHRRAALGLAPLGAMLRTVRHLWRLVGIGRCLARHNALFPLELAAAAGARGAARAPAVAPGRAGAAGPAPGAGAAGAGPELHQARPEPRDPRRPARPGARRRPVAAAGRPAAVRRRARAPA